MNVEEIQSLVWWARDRVRGYMSGLHRSPDFGYSVEFAQHRAYVPGDSPKFIDWSVLAKTDKYLTKQYEAESNLRTYFVLDSSSSMFYPAGEEQKWNRSVRLLTLIAALLLKQRDAMGLLEVSGNGDRFFEARTTEQWLEQMLYHLNGMASDGSQNGDLVEALDSLHMRIPKYSQVILIHDLFVDDFENLVHALQRLKFDRNNVRVMTFFHKRAEMDADGLSGQFVRDRESYTTAQLSVSDVDFLKDYLLNQKELVERLCREQGIDQISLNVEDDPVVMLRRILET
jgi:uncharacterized protein (DUF58 family)